MSGLVKGEDLLSGPRSTNFWLRWAELPTPHSAAKHFTFLKLLKYSLTSKPLKFSQGYLPFFLSLFSCLNKGEADHRLHAFGFPDKAGVSSGFLSTILSDTGGRDACSTVLAFHHRLMSISEGKFSTHKWGWKRWVFIPSRLQVNILI